jgi:ubiquitin-conjugating enzyme E2 M
MIRLKKEAKPAATPASQVASGNGTTEPQVVAEAKASDEGNNNNEGLKLLGQVGGRATKQEGAKITGKKRTPGEIRVQKDIAGLDTGRIATVNFPNPNDLTNFNVVVSPDTGIWQGATYNFSFKIPDAYPHDPPKVLCLTKIYHPNIDLEGKVCLNILRDDWNPVLDVNAVIYGVIYLFYEPNPDDPLNKDAADLYRSDLQQVVHLYIASILMTLFVM